MAPFNTTLIRTVGLSHEQIYINAMQCIPNYSSSNSNRNTSRSLWAKMGIVGAGFVVRIKMISEMNIRFISLMARE